MITAQALSETIGQPVIENEPLSKHTTFKIGGPAKYFFAPQDNESFVAALKAAQEHKLPFFVLGGGSNLLVSDQGFDGLVIKPENRNFTIEGTSVYAESGVMVETLLNATLDAELTGWAWAAGLPGTIGGAVRGNAGAYGEAMGDVVESGEVFVDGKVKSFSKQDFEFSYRHSVVKEKPMVVLLVVMQLQKGDIAAEREQVAAYIDRRKQTQPLDLPNSGCVFKNIDLKTTEIDKEKVMKALDISAEEFTEKTKFDKLPVSYIIDRLNLKGKTIGGAQVSEKHGAFVVNIGNATAEQVIMLMSDVKMHVRNELGIQLQEEIQYVGF